MSSSASWSVFERWQRNFFMAMFVSATEWRPRGIAALEPAGETAVRTDQNTVVVAGPGAGKTELLAQRACYLLETSACSHPRRILAISFKRDAARNLRERVRKRCGDELGRRFDSFTFDAFAKGLLDQFMGALPDALRPTPTYDVAMGSPRADDIAELFDRLGPAPGFGTREDLREHESESFFRTWVVRARFHQSPSSLEEWAGREIWRLLLRGGPRSVLYFAMVARLAGEVIRSDQRVQRAYRSTYSHVFVDEFQDTTDLQYWLTRLLFPLDTAVVTAVGDPQQRIMGWAGAKKQIFSAFRKDFGATEVRLLRNHRASEDIAPIVTYLAARLRNELGESESAAIAALAGGGPPSDACAGYLFDEDESEAEWVASEIAERIARGADPREICVLARMKTAEYTAAIAVALERRGVRARLEEAMQDLLTEPIVLMFLLALRALLGNSPRTAWSQFRAEVGSLRGVDLDDPDAMCIVDRELQQLRRKLFGQPLTTFSAPNLCRAFFQEWFEPLFARAVRGRHAQYRRGGFYEETLKKCCEALASAVSRCSSWDSMLDDVEGHDAVPMLTIHKSKGLEYDAVFFVGLEDGAFWNFKRAPDEELNAFFVAISRAKRRVAFTFSEARTVSGRTRRQSRQEVDQLYELLREASVSILDQRSRS